MKSVISFFSEVKLELGKVVWPKRREVVRLTLIVLAVAFIIGAYVGGLDYLYTKALELIVAK